MLRLLEAPQLEDLEDLVEVERLPHIDHPDRPIDVQILEFLPGQRQVLGRVERGAVRAKIGIVR